MDDPPPPVDRTAVRCSAGAQAGGDAVSCRTHARPIDAIDAVDAAVEGLRAADRAMAGVLRAVAAARPQRGMPPGRVIALSASATSWDVRYLQGVADTLSAMPGVWRAFDDGRIGWSQVRGVVRAAQVLRVADRGHLDDALAAVIDENATSEPERLVEAAEEAAARLDEPRTTRREAAARSRSWLAFQSRLGEPGADVQGHVGDPAALAEILGGLDAAADAPVTDEPAVDDDGHPLPRAWQAGTTRAAQHADALRRVCAAYQRERGRGPGPAFDQAPATADGATPASTGMPGLAAPREARPALYVVADVSQLPETAGLCRTDADGIVSPVTARVLWQLAGGRRPLSGARVHQFSCDAVRIPVLTDGATVLAIGDARDPIGLQLRRAVAVRDQGCRMPGCAAPADHTDVHHVVDRGQGGETVLHNLVALCRRCHTDVHTHGWRLRLHGDGRLTVTAGRRTFTSRPPLRPPPRARPVRADPSDRPVRARSTRAAAVRTNATEPLPF